MKPKTQIKGPAYERSGGVRITMPGMALNPGRAIEQMALGRIEERVRTFYEQEGMVIPDFYMMDRIDKLQALENYRAYAKRIRDEITNGYDAYNKEQSDLQYQSELKEIHKYNLKKAKSDEFTRKQQTANPGQAGQDSIS